jgi:uncharacterized membrane protein
MTIPTTLLFAQVAEVQTISAAGLINSIVPIVGLVGVCTILWGAYNTVVRQIAAETALARGQAVPEIAGAARPAFSHYLSLGLEFMIGASVIKTILSPDLQQVGIVGGMVLIRALVGLYPRWEKPRLAGNAQGLSNDVSAAPVPMGALAEMSVAVSRLSAPLVSATNGTVDACAATPVAAS